MQFKLTTPARDKSQNMMVWFGANQTVTFLPISQARELRFLYLFFALNPCDLACSFACQKPCIFNNNNIYSIRGWTQLLCKIGHLTTTRMDEENMNIELQIKI
jgi:hypothetical protein